MLQTLILSLFALQEAAAAPPPPQEPPKPLEVQLAEFEEHLAAWNKAVEEQRKATAKQKVDPAANQPPPPNAPPKWPLPEPEVPEPQQHLAERLRAIGALDTPEAALALGGLAARLEPPLRGQAVLAVGACRNEPARKLLQELAEDKADDVRRMAARCLADGAPSEQEWLRDKRLKKEKTPGNRAELLHLLLERDVEKLEAAVADAAKDKDKLVLSVGVYGLGRLKLTKHRKLVEDRLGDEDVVLREKCFATLADFGGADSWRSLIEAFADARNLALRNKILIQMRRAKAKDEIAVLMKDGITHKEEAVVAAAIDAIAYAAEHEPEMCGPVLLKMLASSNVDMRTSAIEGIVRARPAGAIQELVKRLDHEDFKTRTDAAWALAQLGDLPVEAEAKFLAMTSDERPSVRLHATDALKWYPKSEAALKALLARFGDELWSVRSAAVATALTFRRVETLAPLVKLAQEEKGRVRDDALRALEALTGEDFGPVAQIWARWLADLPAGYAVPSAEEAQMVREKRLAARKAGEDKTVAARPEYHGIAVPRGGVVFILDISGSMEQYRVSKEQNFHEYFSEALIETIQRLDGDTDFNVVVFSDRVRTWKDKLLPADAQNISDAIEFIRDLRPGGPTNIYEALLGAFEFLETQTIFLMTDGEPNVGPVTDPDGIVAEIEDLNRDRRIIINTIAAGQAQAEFLSELAASNGGQFVDLTSLGVGKKKEPKKP